jgi:lipopolysaccharide transport system ATP-binding protein
MLPEGGIEVSHVWKRFRTYRGRRLLRDRLENFGNRMRGRPGLKNPWRWVLRDIDFKIEPGEAVGVVGVNGSGKSTLLKIISSVMFPHSGRTETNGRVGALLEVSSGIHQDLTGRENIYVYGSLLGISRKELVRKFDEIISFAELEHAVDQQVKFYSSGMKMRLGFSIAASLEPRVLLVDEVLAVGDSSFQHKCMDRMRDVLQSGATLLLVSHDLASVGAIATRGLWLSDGRLAADGPIDSVLSEYRRQIEAFTEARTMEIQGHVRVKDLVVMGPEGRTPSTNEPCQISFTAVSDADYRAALYIGASQGAPTPIFVKRRNLLLPEGESRHTLHLPRLPVPRGRYFLWFAAYTMRREELSAWQPIGPLNVVGLKMDQTPQAIVRLAPFYVEGSWSQDGVPEAMAGARALPDNDVAD